MTIAYVLNTYPQPSHSFIRREIQALERAGFTVHRLAMRGPAAGALVDAGDRDEAARTTYVLARGGWRLAAATLAAGLRSPRRFVAALRLAWRMGRTMPRGLLRHLIYLAEAAWVARRCAALGVRHMHAHFGTNATAVALLAQALGGPGYSFTTHGPEEFDAPQALSLGLKCDRARFAVAVSQFGRSQLCRWAGFATWDRLNVVHCGIEPDRFDTPAPLPEGPLRLVSVGRFVEQKGQMVLVQAMAALRASHPDLHLTLVGDGPMRADLEAAIAQAGLDRQITLSGWLDEAGVRAALNAAHVLALPSFAEGLPMVVMEAMAAGRPVVSTLIAGTPELVVADESPDRTGWLVPAGDARAFAAALAQAADLPRDRLQAMGLAGRNRVLDRHDADTEAGTLGALFARAIAGGTAA